MSPLMRRTRLDHATAGDSSASPVAAGGVATLIDGVAMVVTASGLVDMQLFTFESSFPR